ncbi:telomere-associated RIF1 [Brachionus plicatilis]|uniref:Telomere-associated RIF1 n=1 Tax=Brachionus plicatilis TaxID=10195 RepID=A0A3M7TBU5_BRAPC|nr:telomere-associated RIF1 [Brachionus plicatilis]
MSNDEDDGDREEKLKKILGTKLECEHEFKSLVQIGSEVLVSLIFNDQLKNQSGQFLRKLDFAKKSVDYSQNDLLNDYGTWILLMKYFFDIFMTNKSNQSNDGAFILDTWKHLSCLTQFKSFTESTDDDMIVESQFNQSSIKQVDINSSFLSKYQEFFVTNSLDFVNNFIVNSKNGENKFISSMARLVLNHVKDNYENHYADKTDIKSNLLKLIKKCSNLILTNDESDLNMYLFELRLLFELMEQHTEIVDLYQWIQLTTKFYEYLKSTKNKTNKSNLSEQNLNFITNCIMFPFSHFKILDIQESDIKLVLSCCSNIAKQFSALVKQNRISVENSDGISPNNWCSSLFQTLIQHYKKTCEFSLTHSLSKYWHELYDSCNQPASQAPQLPTMYMIENTLKILQLQSQFTLSLLQNVFEFDPFGELSSQTCEPLGTFISPKRSPSSFPADLIDLVNQQIRLFYSFIKCQTSHLSSAKLSEDQLDSELTKEQSLDITDCKVDKESKVPAHVFTTLIEQLSCLFTRTKNNSTLIDLLVSFAHSIGSLAELNWLSKQETAPRAHSVHSHLNSHFKYPSEKASIQFHCSRKSSDLFDTFSLQISTLVQTTLVKVYSAHEFDSSLLDQFEPIFFSFLSYTTKPGLRQKTLQAWNATFGKSTLQSLNYTKRLESLFLDIKEEMVQKKNATSLVLSLPGFKPLDLLSTNNTTSTFMVQEAEINEEKENTPENLKTESNSSISIAHFVFSPAGRNSFFKQQQQQSASASKAVRTPENKGTRASPRSLRHNSKRKLDLGGLIDQQPDKDFVTISKPEMKSRRSLSLRSKQPLTEHQKETRKNKSFVPMEVQPVDVDSQLSCSVMDEDTSTQTSDQPPAQKMNDQTAMAIFQYKSLASEQPSEQPGEPVLKFHSKINPSKEIEVIEVKSGESVAESVEKLGDCLIDKMEKLSKKKSSIEMLRLRSRLLKKSKKIAKNSKQARKNLLKYRNLIMKGSIDDLGVKQSEQTTQDLDIQAKTITFDNVKSGDVSMNESTRTTDDEDEQPLSILIEKKKLEENLEKVPEETQTPKPILNSVAEEQVTETDKLSVPKNTTDDLIHKLNNTPTTSILKKKMMNQSEPVIPFDLDTPGKRRVSFCESVRIEEIEPNFRKSIFRSTPRIQNKAKIVLSPYFGSKNPAQNVPSPNNLASSSLIIPSTGEAVKPVLSQSAPTTPNSKSVPNVQNSPSSASFLDFISTNRVMSQRSSMIQQQMQSKTESPIAQNKIGLSNTLPVSTPTYESPKSTNRTITLMEGISDFKICDKLRQSKLSIDLVFEKVDTSLYMQKLGSLKYFKYKNILTVGDFCSLNPTEINALPLKCPKYDNYISLVKNFEENSSDLFAKEDKKLVAMGSMEEEMEKLEKMEEVAILDISIECVGERAKMEVEQSKERVDYGDKFVSMFSSYENEMKLLLENGQLGAMSVQELLDLSRKMDQSRRMMADLYTSSQEMIRIVVESKLVKE